MLTLLLIGLGLVLAGSGMIATSYLLFENQKYKKIENCLVKIGIPLSSAGWVMMLLATILMIIYGL